MYRLLILNLLTLFIFQNTSFATDRSLIDVAPYQGNDPIYTRFIQKFTNVVLYQKGQLSDSQKQVVSLVTLKTLIDNYEASFISNAGLRAIVVHQDSRIYCSYMPEGRPCPQVVGWADAGSKILNVVASTQSSAIFIGTTSADYSSCGANAQCMNAAAFIRSGSQIIHHELFHSLDTNPNETAWAALNPEGWTPQQSTSVSVGFNSELEGFVSSYASTGVVEDRAETFAHMMLNSSQVTNKAEDDSYLRSKILALKAYLTTLCRNESTCRIPSVFADFE